MTFLRFLFGAGCFCLAVTGVRAADLDRHVIIFEGLTTEAAAPAEPAKDLWVTLSDLTRATKFELKPEGVCTAKLCFPLPPERKNDFISRRGDTTWFNLSEFARLLKQPVAADAKLGVWYFGPRPEQQNGYLGTLLAPDFTLPDINGMKHSLADFRGKKVLLITWASW
jgi:hypothetical protein